jgi:hypothetical protein
VDFVQKSCKPCSIQTRQLDAGIGVDNSKRTERCNAQNLNIERKQGGGIMPVPGCF